MNHTPEPWESKLFPGDPWISWADAEKFFPPGKRTMDLDKAQYERARVCVNACRGIPEPEETVPELAERLRAMEKRSRSGVSPHCRLCGELLKNFDTPTETGHGADCPVPATQALLAKLKGT